MHATGEVERHRVIVAVWILVQNNIAAIKQLSVTQSQELFVCIYIDSEDD